MRKPAAFAVLVAGLATTILLGTGAAHADREHTPIRASAPQPIAEVLRAGGGTVAGTVTALGANWFTISDGTAQADVTVRHFLPEGIGKDDQITVIGKARRGGLMASEIILADGTSHGSAPDTARSARLDEDDD
jgi:cytochrome c-type biogenesis protein CcmE